MAQTREQVGIQRGSGTPDVEDQKSRPEFLHRPLDPQESGARAQNFIGNVSFAGTSKNSTIESWEGPGPDYDCGKSEITRGCESGR